MPTFFGPGANQLEKNFNINIQHKVRNIVRFESQEKWEAHAKTLAVQGKIFVLAAAEKEDLIWKSYMFNLKAGTLKFLLNASIDNLPTAANLKCWKKAPSDLCKLCRCRQTTDHLLSKCSFGPNKRRFLYRDNYIINYIVSCVDTTKYKVYSDLKGHQVSGCNTIPPEICVTSDRPDIVILEESTKKINILELTCPSEENIDKRNKDKLDKYAHFLTDITTYTTFLTCFEVSMKGFYLRETICP